MAYGKADGSIVINTKILEAGFNKGVASMKDKLSGFGRSIEGTMDRTAAKIEQIGKLIAVGFSLGKLIEFGKEAIQLGSDLAEMENVTSTVFPHMTKEIDEWSDAALNNFGLTRIMAKNYVGTFGAMAKAFGFTEKQAYDMSTQLAGLSGDVASFYNLSQDEAFGKLKAIFTGETESLKSLGVVMTQTALDQYALANGFGKTVSQMTEAEKVELRMAFVTDKLSAASGDFIKTQDSWANQTKRLTANFQELKTTIGQGLINLFTPIIKGINTLLSYLHTAANAFNTFTATLMGKKSGGSGGGATSVAAAASGASESLGSVADSTANAADATDDYAAAEKKAQKAANGYLSALDEVNRYTIEQAADTGSSTPKTGKSGTGSAASDLPNQIEQIYDDSAFAVDDIAGEFSEFADKLRKAFESGDWDGLGRLVGQKINGVVDKIKDAISWEKVGPTITKFVTAFTTAFNALVDEVDFENIGSTVGAGVNTIVNTFNLLITGINWKNLGKKFSDGINGLVDEVDWKDFGNLIGNKFMISWNIFDGFISGLNFSAIGTAIGDGVNGAIEKIDTQTIGASLGKYVSGLYKILTEAAQKIDWGAVGTKVSTGINAYFENFKFSDIAVALATWASGLLTALETAFSTINWAGIMENIKGAFSRVNFAELGTQIITTVWAAINGGSMSSADRANVLEAFSSLESTLRKLSGFVFSGLESFYTNFLQPLSNWVLAEAFPQLAEIVSTTFAGVNWDNLTSGLGNLWSVIEKFTEGIGQGLIDFFSGIAKYVLNPVLSLLTGAMGDSLGKLLDPLDGKNGSTIKAIGEGIGVVLGAFTTYKITTGIANSIGTLGANLPALLSAVVKHPAVTLIAAGAAVGIALKNIWDNAHEIAIDDTIKTVATDIASLSDTLAASDIKADADYSYINSILDKYAEVNEKLANGEDITAGEEAMLQEYGRILGEYSTKIAGQIDPITGAYNGTKEALQKLIDEQYRQVKFEAYQNVLKQYWSDIAAIEIRMQELSANIEGDMRDAAKNAISAYNTEMSSSGLYHEVFDISDAEWEKNFQDYIAILNGADKATLNLSGTYNKFAQIMRDHAVDQMWNNYSASMEEANRSMEEAQRGISATETVIKNFAKESEASANKADEAAAKTKRSVDEKIGKIPDKLKEVGDAGALNAQKSAQDIAGTAEAAALSVDQAATDAKTSVSGSAEAISGGMESAGESTSRLTELMETYKEKTKEAKGAGYELGDATNKLRDAYIAAGGNLRYLTQDNLKNYVAVTLGADKDTLNLSGTFDKFSKAVSNGSTEVKGAMDEVVTAQGKINSTNKDLSELETEITSLGGTIRTESSSSATSVKSDSSKMATGIGEADTAFVSFANESGEAAKAVTRTVSGMTGDVSKTLTDHENDGVRYGEAIVDGSERGVGNRRESLKERIRSVASDDVSQTFINTLGISGGTSSVMEESGSAAIKGAESGAQSVQQSLFNAITGIAGGVSSAMRAKLGISGGTSTDMQEAGQSAISGMQAGAESKSWNLGHAFRAIAGSASDELRNKLGISGGVSSVFKESGQTTIDSMQSGSEAERSGLLDIFTQLPQQMIGKLGDLYVAFVLPGKAIIDAINNGVNQLKPTLLSTLEALPAQMVSKFDSLNNQMWTVGHNAAQNLVNGWRSVHIPSPVFNVGAKWASIAGQFFQVPNVSVSWMASGGVIPKNSARFLAGLGDNNHETEVVSPVSTMKQAFSEALLEAGITPNSGSGSRGPIKVQINRRTVFEETMAEAREQMERTGINPFDLATT